MSLKMSASSVFAFVAAAAAVSACTLADDPQGTESSSSSNDALSTVVGCQMADQTCRMAAKTAADDAACRQGLSSCLMSLFSDAGRPPFPQRSDDAGFPEPPQRPDDAGFPVRPPFPDGGFPRPDGGFPRPPVPGFDGGPPMPPPVPDGGVLDPRACLDDLQKCLFSKTDPMTCAADARACLTAAATARCDDREKACVAAKRPQAICDAERKNCR